MSQNVELSSLKKTDFMNQQQVLPVRAEPISWLNLFKSFFLKLGFFFSTSQSTTTHTNTPRTPFGTIKDPNYSQRQLEANRKKRIERIAMKSIVSGSSFPSYGARGRKRRRSEGENVSYDELCNQLNNQKF